MKDYGAELWRRAIKALATAQRETSSDSDTAASRAYYACFYAASAVLALDGKTFKSHATVEAAVHRDLVRTGLWPTELGSAYREIRRLRATADYGGFEHVETEDAEKAVEQAAKILDHVRKTHPDLQEEEAE